MLEYTQGLSSLPKYNYIIHNDYHFKQQQKRKGMYIFDEFASDVAKYGLKCPKTAKPMLIEEMNSNT